MILKHHKLLGESTREILSSKHFFMMVKKIAQFLSRDFHAEFELSPILRNQNHYALFINFLKFPNVVEMILKHHKLQ